MKGLIASCAVALLSLGTSTVQAAASCTVTAAPTLDYGMYSNAVPSDATGDIVFACVPDLPLNTTVSYSIRLGTGSSGSFHPRRLAGAGSGLNYNLHPTAARVQVWGDGALNSGTVIRTGSCTGNCSVPVYGRIAAGQNVPNGNYRDDLVITLEF